MNCEDFRFIADVKALPVSIFPFAEMVLWEPL